MKKIYVDAAETNFMLPLSQMKLFKLCNKKTYALMLLIFRVH
jgi:hypothetical protein